MAKALKMLSRGLCGVPEQDRQVLKELVKIFLAPETEFTPTANFFSHLFPGTELLLSMLKDRLCSPRCP